MQIAVVDVVLSIARRLRSRECDTRAFPPERVAGELETPCQPAHVGHGRTEWLGGHLESGEVDQAVGITWIGEADQRKNSVDFVEAEFLLISSRHLKNLEPARGTERF